VEYGRGNATIAYYAVSACLGLDNRTGRRQAAEPARAKTSWRRERDIEGWPNVRRNGSRYVAAPTGAVDQTSRTRDAPTPRLRRSCRVVEQACSLHPSVPMPPRTPELGPSPEVLGLMTGQCHGAGAWGYTNLVDPELSRLIWGRNERPTQFPQRVPQRVLHRGQQQGGGGRPTRTRLQGRIGSGRRIRPGPRPQAPPGRQN